MYVHLYKSTFKSFKSFIVSLFCSVDFEHLLISVCLSYLFIYIVDEKFSLLLFLLIEVFFFFLCVCVCVCVYVCMYVCLCSRAWIIVWFYYSYYLLHLCKQFSSLGKWFTFAPREPYIFPSTTALLKYPFYLGFSVFLHFHLCLHKPFNAFSSTYISCSIWNSIYLHAIQHKLLFRSFLRGVCLLSKASLWNIEK